MTTKGEAVPPSGEEFMTPEQLAEVRRYSRVDRICAQVDRGLDLLYLGVFAFFLAAPVDAWLVGLGGAWTSCIYIRAVALLLIMTAGHALVSLPLSFYSGYIVEKRFGMSTLTAWRWLKRYAGRIALATLLNSALLLAAFFLMRSCGAWWWLAAGVVFFFFSTILGVLLPVVVLPMFYKIEKLEDASLLERLQKLTPGTGLTLEGVYRMDLSAETTKANAMLAGLGGSRRVLLGDTLLENFTPEEIEAIFAHEVGHHVHHHLQKMLVFGFLGSFAAFYLMDIFLREAIAPQAGGLLPLFWNPGFGYAELPLMTLPLFLFGMMVWMTLFEPVQNALSRYFENQSDAYAVEKTSAGAMIAAFQKLAIQNKADPNDVSWMHSHPSIAERIRRCAARDTDADVENMENRG